MKKCYGILPGSSGGAIDAVHPWKMPYPISCPQCENNFSVPGVNYPSVNIGSILAPDIQKLMRRSHYWKTNWEQFRLVADSLKGRLKPEIILYPCSGFGKLEGVADGSVCDFERTDEDSAWVVKEESYKALKSTGLQFAGVSASITSNGRHDDTFWELDALPTARLSGNMGEGLCKECHRVDYPEEELALIEASIPVDCSVFRAVEEPSEMIVTEEFVNAVRHLGLTGLKFFEIPVV